jgi:hypothetical protein
LLPDANGRLRILANSFLTPQNLTIIVKNTRFSITPGTIDGMRLIFINCIMTNSLSMTVTSGSVTMINCTFIDPVLSPPVLYNCNLTFTGTASYKIIDTVFGDNSSFSSVSTESFNISSGPARLFNRVSLLGSAVGVTSLVANTITILPMGIIVSNPLNVINPPASNLVSLLVRGNYRVVATLEIDTLDLITPTYSASIWFGQFGTNELTSLSTTTFTRDNVNNIVTYPTTRKDIEFELVTTGFISLGVYARNLGTTSFNVRMIRLVITQTRGIV